MFRYTVHLLTRLPAITRCSDTTEQIHACDSAADTAAERDPGRWHGLLNFGQEVTPDLAGQDGVAVLDLKQCFF